ncbi:hypothetical protein M441DRAFT_48264 [Trichoderma asperellum CBS 433.97]|uniref:Uncharacterized protein n=1 Tax=Trichoderma asperellum (strain ATCC 204424 / CBS 433.97 / NBRC 101777) TaxID=1042311 RepID=A0A2T3Z6K0_TRIA4|nr:hypothetical protein M441DRAFT_48264 [Trichoderma asperellum CBS 433.97]PTB40424.1 hypothetical protein M441DRAFT_48264 [Trichoderma asperellum CBS 433.97]
MSHQSEYNVNEPLKPEFIQSNKSNKPVSEVNKEVLYIITTQYKKDLKPFELYAKKKLPHNTVYVHGIFETKTNSQIYTKEEAIKTIQNKIKTAKIKAKYTPAIWWRKEIKKFKGTVIYIGIDFFIEGNDEHGCIVEERPNGDQEVYYTIGQTYPERFVKGAKDKGWVKPNVGRVTVSKIRAKECPGIDHKNPWKGKKYDSSKGHFLMDRQDIIMEALSFKLGLDYDRADPPNWRNNELSTIPYYLN